MRTAIHVDGAKRMRPADVEDENTAEFWQIHELHAIRSHELASRARRLAARVRFQFILLARVVERLRPRLERYVLKLCGRLGDADLWCPDAVLSGDFAVENHLAIRSSRRRPCRRSRSPASSAATTACSTAARAALLARVLNALRLLRSALLLGKSSPYGHRRGGDHNKARPF